jgi:membrane fusion protein (multidrug efflux system)
MRRIAAMLLALLPAAALAQGNAQGAPQPSVLVTAETPRQGTLPRTLTAYGTVQAAPNGGSETLSLLRGGQVLRLTAAVGQSVRKGQSLLTVRADPTALATYRQAVAALTLATGQRTRTAQLLAQHLATRDQLAQADKAVADARSTLDALNRAGGGSAEQTLTAPFDGIVSSLLVTAGARIAPQAPLITLARSSRLVAALGIEPSQRGLVAPGQPARIEPLDGAAATQGSVLSVGAMLDPASHLVPVFVDPPQADQGAGPAGSPAEAATGLLAGSPVRAVIQTGTLHGWLVPRNAVLTDAKGPYVFQVNGGKAARVDVQIAGMQGSATLVAGPIDPAHPLVTSGNYQLQDGGLVREDKTAAGGPSQPDSQP